jgi:hypothetical protein
MLPSTVRLLFIIVFSASISLTMPIAAAQGFKIDISKLSPSPVSAGGTATSNITVTPDPGFNQQVVLSLGNTCPSGASCVLTPPTANTAAGKTKSVLTVNPTTSAPAQSTVTVTGTAGASTQSASVTLTVSAGAAGATTGTASDQLKNNFGFGVALGLSANVTGPNIVNNATIDANGMVRVNTRANTSAGFMLETHYYVFPRATTDMLNGTEPDNRSWGIGPFVAAQPGSSQIIEAVGAGLMIGFRRPKGSTPSGFGLGLGYEAIPSAQVLGSEFVDGQKAPVGSNGQPLPIRYETQDKGSVLVVLSVTF